MPKTLQYLLWGLLIAVYSWFCWMMVEISLQYVPWNTDVAFLRIKQDYVHLGYYRVAFAVHAYTALWVLLAGFTQFSKSIRKKWRRLHRWGGWAYVATVLLLAGPSGLVIGLYANGGIWSQIAFCLLGVLWIFFTGRAALRAKRLDFRGHQYDMWRSFALALSAITLRAWKWGIVAVFHPHPMDAYRIVAWLGWVLNLAIAEILILKYLKK